MLVAFDLKKGEQLEVKIALSSATIDGACRNMQAELIEMPSIKAMNDAQTEFSNLLTQVNQVLRFIITGQVDDGGCGGNCASCGGSCGSAHEHDEDCDCGHDHE